MKNNLSKQLPLLTIISLPFLYLGYLWSSLPNKVPMHWNIDGEIDRYGDKIELLWIPFMLPLLTYLILQIVPKMDPKGKLDKMGKKYDSLKLIIVTFMSLLALYIIYTAANPNIMSNNMIYAMIGGLCAVLGNYFKTIKENYFVGIRTPWTLENPIVWKNTHKMAGILWMAGGIVIVISSFVLTGRYVFIAFMSIIGIMSIIPLVYSYLDFQKQKEI